MDMNLMLIIGTDGRSIAAGIFQLQRTRHGDRGPGIQWPYVCGCTENHRHWRRYHLHPGGGQADEGQGRMLRGLRAAGKHKVKNTNAKTGLHTSHMESRYHFTHQSLLNKELIAGIWHKSDMTCALDSYSQGSLVLCTVACDTAGKDFSSLGYVSL